MVEVRTLSAIFGCLNDSHPDTDRQDNMYLNQILFPTLQSMAAGFHSLNSPRFGIIT